MNGVKKLIGSFVIVSLLLTNTGSIVLADSISNYVEKSDDLKIGGGKLLSSP